MRPFVFAAVLFSLQPALAQQTHVVSDVGEFLFELGGAAPIDLILMEPGTYSFVAPDEFRIDRPIRIAARIPGTVIVETETGAVVDGTDPGTVVSIDGITFRHVGFPFSGSGPGLEAVVVLGGLFLHDCRFEGTGVDGSILPARGFPGLEALLANVFASECEFVGAPVPGTGSSTVPPPGAGIVSTSSEIHLDACAVAGPDGVDASFGPTYEATAGAPAIELESALLVASRTTFEAGSGGNGLEITPGECLAAAPGGHAIFAPATTSGVDLFACDLRPGFGGSVPAGCGGGVELPGQELAGAGLIPQTVGNSPFALGLDAPGTVQGGGLALFTLQGVEYASPKFLLLSSSVALLASPTTGFPIVVGPPQILVPLPTSGSAAFSIPDLGSSGLHVGFLIQGLELPSTLVPVLHPSRFVGVY